MAIRAYILIETAVGKTREVVSALRFIEEAESVDAMTDPRCRRGGNPEPEGHGGVNNHQDSSYRRSNTVTCLVI